MARPRRLPVLKGYTVDCRLREFRKVSWKRGTPSMKTVRFDSRAGANLIRKIGMRKLAKACR